MYPPQRTIQLQKRVVTFLDGYFDSVILQLLLEEKYGAHYYADHNQHYDLIVIYHVTIFSRAKNKFKLRSADHLKKYSLFNRLLLQLTAQVIILYLAFNYFKVCDNIDDLLRKLFIEK